MVYFKIGEKDFSAYVSGLKVKKSVTYNAQTNAAGNSVVDYVNSKRTIEVTIIPVDEKVMLSLLVALDAFNVSISFLNPHTNAIETANCIIPENEKEYYTIRTDKTMFKAMTLTFIEL